jgi:hypothetical protein
MPDYMNAVRCYTYEKSRCWESHPQRRLELGREREKGGDGAPNAYHLRLEEVLLDRGRVLRILE